MEVEHLKDQYISRMRKKTFAKRRVTIQSLYQKLLSPNPVDPFPVFGVFLALCLPLFNTSEEQISLSPKVPDEDLVQEAVMAWRTPALDGLLERLGVHLTTANSHTEFLALHNYISRFVCINCATKMPFDAESLTIPQVFKHTCPYLREDDPVWSVNQFRVDTTVESRYPHQYDPL